ncbi:MAG: GSCFA domain-containing protein [Cytophagales bacterium]|nr:GSCFA domain-containing protein [Cytophagales bacterium]
MDFRTPVTVVPMPFRLSHTSPILTLGSCFADAMGERLVENKFNALVNPFGTVFNPVSIARLLDLAHQPRMVAPGRMVETESRWRHYDFHSMLTGDSPEELLAKIDQKLLKTADFLQTAHCLVLTLGTSVVYRLRADGQVVANCHKAPAVLFDKGMLTLDEAVSALEAALSAWLAANPSLRIILTVSPVRHVKDTLPTNSVSKALLRVACHLLAERNPRIAYFPAYEIMLDDLRDYRFYEDDMIHPTKLAETYIWEQFAEACFDEETRRFLPEWEKIKRDLMHRPFAAQSVAYRHFLTNLEQKLVDMSARVNVAMELSFVQSQLATPNKATTSDRRPD